jgi:YD repeat-containing protein
VTEEFAQAGTYVVWLGLPIPRGSGYREGFVDVNRVLRSVAAAHPHRAAFVDTWSMFEDSHGRYADYVRDAAGRLVRMRAADGVHYAPAAGDLIAHTVLRLLKTKFALEPR